MNLWLLCGSTVLFMLISSVSHSLFLVFYKLYSFDFCRQHTIHEIVRVASAIESNTLVAAINLQTDDQVTATLGLYVAITVVADAIIVRPTSSTKSVSKLRYDLQLYRVLVVWNYVWWIYLLPFPLFLGDIGKFTISDYLQSIKYDFAAMGVTMVVTLGQLRSKPLAYYAQRQATVTEAFLAVTLTMNGLSSRTVLFIYLQSSNTKLDTLSVLIAFKIWYTQWRIKKETHGVYTGSEGLNNIIAIILESGMLSR